MADPTKFTPGYGYSGWQASNPAKPLPANQVDNDFANVELSIDETIEALKDVRRSDGALKNGIVTADSLSSGLTLGLETPTAWETGVVYSPLDTVFVDESPIQGLYRALAIHTSTVFAADLAEGDWELIFDLSAAGLGALAFRDTISGSDWDGADLALADGGTGASTASAARTNLGLGALAVKDTIAAPADINATGTPGANTALFGDGAWKTVAGGGDMLESVYDPQGVEDDVFDRANHTGAQAISTVTGLQTALDGKVVLNADDGVSLASTTTTLDWSGPFGGAWKVANKFESSDASTFAGSRATVAFKRTVTGSGANGPATADYAIFASTEKENYLTTDVVGEIDVDCRTFSQGKFSDCSAFLGDGTKVGGGDGGSIMVELANKWVDGAGTAVRRIQVGVNFLEGAGGLSGGTGYGFWTEAQVGNLYAGVCVDQAQASTGASFANAFVHAKNRNELISLIDGAGRTRMSDGDAALPAYGFLSDPDTGVARLGANAFGFVTGGAYRWYVGSSGAYIPGADNAYDFGAISTSRIRNIYTVNAPTVGSDERLKTDIEDSPLGLDFIRSLRPVAYRLKHGGTRIDYEDVEVEVEEPVTERKEVIREEKHFDGQKIVVRKTKAIEDVPVMETVQVFNEDGTPATDKFGAPATYAVPKTRTVKKTEKRPVEVAVEGKRVHYGLLAQDVKRQMVAAGVKDFGGYVVDDMDDPDSLLSLRYEQFVAPLIKAITELAAEVDSLKAQRAA